MQSIALRHLPPTRPNLLLGPIATAREHAGTSLPTHSPAPRPALPLRPPAAASSHALAGARHLLSNGGECPRRQAGSSRRVSASAACRAHPCRAAERTASSENLRRPRDHRPQTKRHPPFSVLCRNRRWNRYAACNWPSCFTFLLLREKAYLHTEKHIFCVQALIHRSRL